MIRKARKEDVADIVKQREDYREPLPEQYYSAFGHISELTESSSWSRKKH